MLNDTDIHYLVGLLTRVKEEDDVTIELGDMVLDVAAGKRRDVDITAYYTDKDGIRSAYRGIEVKNHVTRPLTVEHVEQLCQKFADMPDISHTGIVSASGYTKGAINKAKAHKVELFEIIDWLDPGKGFNVYFQPEVFKFVEPRWTDGPHCKINVSPDNLSKITPPLRDLEVCYKTGSPIPNVPNVDTLFTFAYKTAADDVSKKGEMAIKDGDTISVNTLVNFEDEPCIKVGHEVVEVESCNVKGVITCKVHDKPILKVFRKHGEKRPIAGCAIIETDGQALLGISVNNVNNRITMLNIPYADRVRKKIRGRKF